MQPGPSRSTGIRVSQAAIRRFFQLEGLLFGKDHTAKVAMVGLGGIGKTQLVLKLLFQTKDEHPDYSII
jgi:GTPase SAR1 family protein